MAIAGKIAYNFIVSSLGRAIGLFFSLATIAFAARALSVSGYGQYSTISAFLFLFLGIADLGLYSLMLREISKPGADEKYITGTFFTLRLISSIAFLGAASLLVLFFPYQWEIKAGVGFCSLGFIFLSLSQILMPIFQKYLRTDRAALSEVLGRFIQLLMAIMFFKMGLGLFWFLFAMISSSALTFFLNLFFARKYVLFSLNFDQKYFREILRLTYPIALSIIFTMVYFRGNTILLSVLKSQKDVGIFNLGYKVLDNLAFFPAVLVGLMMPILSYYAVKDIKTFCGMFQKSFNILATGAIPLFFGGIFASPLIVMILGGRDFRPAVFPLQILILSTVFIFFGNLTGNSLIALHRQKDLIWIYFFGAIFGIATNLLLIPGYSYIGTALSSLFTEFFVTALMFAAIFKTVRWFPSLKLLPKIFFASFLMCLPLIFTLKFGSPLVLLILYGLSIFIYFTTLYFLKGISKDEILSLVKIKND